MAGPRLSPMLILLLALALASAGQGANNTGERIINGVPCPRGKQPWQVALFVGPKFLCAGVLVREQWVLTVAHCNNSEYVVQTGSDLLLDAELVEINATESFIHPQYNNITLDHDIMLVKLSRPAQLSPTVSTVDVPSRCSTPRTRCTVSGWGTISPSAVMNPLELMCSDVRTMSTNNCKKFYNVGVGRHVLCAAHPDRLSQTCEGDSGDPLMCNGSLQGLVSQGYIPCVPKFIPVLYTRVCKYRQWITATIEANS